ncbi:Uncharacterised protein [BD1-7 clade bacterium]|uniref:Transposase IS200-like domain-containing protein n=1 Tax=BD1-7 clade bacterium TaxID=2029982 RepID=A0A5S9PJZ2_9GAMM|nr:Uncharacterised protein [BD1-7 clade bacterium]
MTLLPRPNLPGIPQHVVQRGNNRQVCFFADEDYAVYLDRLHHYAKEHDVSVHAFVLMTNHVHLLLTRSSPDGVSRLMQSLGRYYVRYINTTYQRSGTLWEGRYKLSLLESDRYLFAVYRYIEMNPVRALMVEKPDDYRWSSYHHNALGKPIALVTEHRLYLALASEPIQRQIAYRAMFDLVLVESDLGLIRSSINRGLILGDERFKQQIEAALQRRVQPGQHGGDRKSERFLEEV